MKWPLRIQFLVPLALGIAITAIFVTSISSWYARRSARLETEEKLHRIGAVLNAASFPLIQPVMNQIRDLSAVEVLLIDQNKRVIATNNSLPVAAERVASWAFIDESQPNGIVRHKVDIEPSWDIYWKWLDSHNGEKSRAIVLLSRHELQERLANQAIILPTITGVAASAIVAFIAVLLAKRIESRLKRLSCHVDRIAKGNFEKLEVEKLSDEISTLTMNVNSMATQLDQSYRHIASHQRERLINQFASGMAHQLRNTLAGAKLAIQSHQLLQDENEANDDLRVAIDQLKIAEESIRTILHVKSGGFPETTPPMKITVLLKQLQFLVQSKVAHHKIGFSTNVEGLSDASQVVDGQTILGVLLNLVLNSIDAMQFEGPFITVRAIAIMDADSADKRSRCLFTVIDNGIGPDPSIAATMMDPFVTSKREGVGIGLSMAKNVVERWGGELRWSRSKGLTRFEFDLPLANECSEISHVDQELDRLPEKNFQFENGAETHGNSDKMNTMSAAIGNVMR